MSDELEDKGTDNNNFGGWVGNTENDGKLTKVKC